MQMSMVSGPDENFMALLTTLDVFGSSTITELYDWQQNTGRLL